MRVRREKEAHAAYRVIVGEPYLSSLVHAISNQPVPPFSFCSLKSLPHPTKSSRQNHSSFLVTMASTAFQSQAPAATPVPNQPLPEDGELEADHDSLRLGRRPLGNH